MTSGSHIPVMLILSTEPSGTSLIRLGFIWLMHVMTSALLQYLFFTYISILLFTGEQ